MPRPAWRRVAVAAAAIRRAAAAEVGDPATYAEPGDPQYWGCAAPPCDVERVKSADLTRESFDRRIVDGRVFVVEDLGRDWPMSNWTCDYFRSDELFSQADMVQDRGEQGVHFIPLKSDWREAKVASGVTDSEAPKVAAYYWGVKDVQHADASFRSKTWRTSMLKKVQEHIRLPSFMDSGNLGFVNATPEFWFAGEGAGAKAHMDSHPETTMSLQLSGTKRWRIRFMEAKRTPCMAFTYRDGDVYTQAESWRPALSIVLHPGQALFLPPGFVHETLCTAGCSASVTFQFLQPMPVRLYRRFLPRVRRTADIHEAWLMIARWATLHGLRDPALTAGQAHGPARDEALGHKGVGGRFRQVDADGDGFLTSAELESAFPEGRGWLDESKSILNFHDLDEDGRVTREEFAEVFAYWAAIAKDVVKATPKAYRNTHFMDLRGDFSLEDVNDETRERWLKDFNRAERAAAAGAASAAVWGEL